MYGHKKESKLDARITKERLSNLLSYDWLKMILCAIAAVLVLAVFFTTVRTMPTEAQTYTVYAWTDINAGDDSTGLKDALKKNGVFSYEILKIQSESFQGNSYSEAAFTARRAAGEGNCMFISNQPPKYAEDGTVSEPSALQDFLSRYPGIVLDTEQYLKDCENYLNGFYGGNWKEGELDGAEAEKCFRARNTGDKRFKKQESILAGIESEKERIAKLRGDLLFVEKCFEDGLYSHISGTDEINGEFSCAVQLGGGGMSGLTRLYSYVVERDGSTVKSSEALSLVLFDNGSKSGDTKFESVSFLRYLAETYRNVQA